jgi:hypothetical protein
MQQCGLFLSGYPAMTYGAIFSVGESRGHFQAQLAFGGRTPARKMT